MNPEVLAKNALWRLIVNNSSFFNARAILRAGIVPPALPPWKKAKLKKRVKRQLSDCFPLLSETAIDACAEKFTFYWSQKLVDDCFALNLKGSEKFKRVIEEHMLFVGEDNYIQATERGKGVICVGAHFSALSLCTPALIYMMLKHPQPNQFMRITTEPDLERFPAIMQSTRHALTRFNLDVDYIITSAGHKYVASTMADTLRQGGIVTTNMDVLRGGSGKRIFYLFESQIPVVLSALVGACRMALQTGATLLPWVARHTASGFLIRLEKPIIPPQITQKKISADNPDLKQLSDQLKSVLQDWILSAPEQWVYWDRFGKRRVQSPEYAPKKTKRQP